MKTFVLLAALATLGFTAPTGVNKRDLADRSNFDGIYIGPSVEGETVAEKRQFVGTYVPAGEEGETAEKRALADRSNFDGIYIGPSVEGETAVEKRQFAPNKAEAKAITGIACQQLGGNSWLASLSALMGLPRPVVMSLLGKKALPTIIILNPPQRDMSTPSVPPPSYRVKLRHVNCTKQQATRSTSSDDCQTTVNWTPEQSPHDHPTGNSRPLTRQDFVDNFTNIARGLCDGGYSHPQDVEIIAADIVWEGPTPTTSPFTHDYDGLFRSHLRIMSQRNTGDHIQVNYFRAVVEQRAPTDVGRDGLCGGNSLTRPGLGTRTSGHLLAYLGIGTHGSSLQYGRKSCLPHYSAAEMGHAGGGGVVVVVADSIPDFDYAVEIGYCDRHARPHFGPVDVWDCLGMCCFYSD
ncbi:hypothetical protein O1611_g2039 [Lasiodiplodia mahajangana]|uniref:Uncharacterized protein n=1 Tax=Lasiodiplodia mahajangana TaxID=1108764 RepID=A0ACC2JWK4_9PEZI|nr:hypothetical protein O1611_g2039 [Lasiodiplodia mahajangana]